MPRQYYVPGAFYRRDDRSGFRVHSFNTEKEWNGQWIRKDMWEARNAQDFVRGIADEQAAPEPRPTPTPIYLGPLTTTTTANAAAGATTLLVESTARMLVGDAIEVLVGTDDGAQQFRTTIQNIPNSTTLTLFAALPYATPSGNLVTDVTANAIVNSADFPASNGGGPF